MKCPTIEKKETASKESNLASATPCDTHSHSEKVGAERDPPAQPSDSQNPSPKKKKRLGLKVLLFFSILAVITGSALGFVVARGIVDWRDYLPIERFTWTDISEGVSQDTVLDVVEDSKEKKDEELSTYESETDTLIESEDTVPEEIVEPIFPSEDSNEATAEQSDSHYSKSVDDTLLIIDDKAKLLSDNSITLIMDKAKEISSLSDYSIMIILTNDLFGMTIEEFTNEYYNSTLEKHKEEANISEKGFAFVIYADHDEYFITAFGNAKNKISNSKKTAMVEIIQPSLEADDFETALISLLENTPY